MDARDIRREFFRSIRKVQHVPESVPHDTEEQGRKRFNRKVFTYVVGTSDRHILRRSK